MLFQLTRTQARFPLCPIPCQNGRRKANEKLERFAPEAVMNEQTEPIPSWRLKGDWFDLCSCNIGCPCVFGANPTTGTCEGVLTCLL
jgi:hypothetical protein